jgi:hypothetical protein
METVNMDATARQNWIKNKIKHDNHQNRDRVNRLTNRDAVKSAAEAEDHRNECHDPACACYRQAPRNPDADNGTFAEEPYSVSPTSDPALRDFLTETFTHLKGIMDSGKYYLLLRDVAIDDAMARKWAYKLRTAQEKCHAVYHFCRLSLEHLDKHGMIIGQVEYMLANPSEYPGLNNSCHAALLTLAGIGVGTGLSRATVGRHLSEYKYFDAEAHNLPVTPPLKDHLYGRAVSLPPGGKGGFHSDLRGSHTHPHFLFNQPDLRAKVTTHMSKLGS